MEEIELLLMTGRKVAKPARKVEKPQVELRPKQIHVMLDTDRVRSPIAQECAEAATMALKAAAEGKDKG